jgi:hypothetical protein
MRIIFSIISIAYIAAIFLFAGSPMVSDLAPFNPYSLLHIPLYGILTALLILSFFPMKLNRVNSFSRLRFNEPNVPNECNAFTHTRIHTSTHIRFFLSGVIALMVAIADEIHQSVIPTRNASITDVFLDAIGIVLVLFLLVKFYRKKKFLLHLAQPTN